MPNASCKQAGPSSAFPWPFRWAGLEEHKQISGSGLVVRVGLGHESGAGGSHFGLQLCHLRVIPDFQTYYAVNLVATPAENNALVAEALKVIRPSQLGGFL